MEGSIILEVAKNISTSEVILGQLAKHKEAVVKIYVASNPVIPFDLLQSLSLDPNEQVRNVANVALKHKRYCMYCLK